MKLLVVRVGRVGDTVMMTPALKGLIEYFPDAEITLLTSPVGKLLLQNFHENIVDNWTWNRSGILRPLIDKNAILERLKQSDFDRIICFDTSPRIAKLFSDCDTEFHQYRGSKVLIHCARAYLEFIAEVFDKPVVETYNYLPIDDEASKQVDEELSSHGISAQDRVLMIHPTFSGYSPVAIRKRHAKLRKLWAPENYGRLIKQITDSDPDIKVMMVLLPDEISFGEKIQSHCEGKALLLRSESTFERYKAMISRADVLLTPDSGPMHMASALGTSIAAFFSMKDPGDCGPYMDPSRFIILRSEDTDNPERGVNAIDVDSVHDACMKLLHGRS